MPLLETSEIARDQGRDGAKPDGLTQASYEMREKDQQDTRDGAMADCLTQTNEVDREREIDRRYGAIQT